MLLFHDIKPVITDINCGVYQAIYDSGLTLDEEITSNDVMMGIGISYIK